MGEGYEYDSESDGMREALDRAREQSNGGVIDLDAMMADLGQTGGGDEPSVDAPAEEQPSKLTGDESMRSGSTPERVGRPPPVPPPEESAQSALPRRPWERWAGLKYDLEQADRTAPPQDGQLIAKMKAVGWDPAKSTRTMDRPDWEQLQRDLQDAERASDSKRAFGASLHAVAPGFVPPDNPGGGRIAAARSAIDIARTREQAQRQQESTDFNRSATLARLDAADRASGDLAAMRRAQADRWRSTDERERAAADARAKSEAEKATAAAGAREADASSLRVMKQQWLNTSPHAGEHGLTAADLDGITSRKDWEDFLRMQEKGSKAARSTGPAPARIRRGDLGSIPDEGDRALVSSILGGKTNPSGISRKDSTRIMKLVTQIDPSFDATTFPTYAGVKKKLAESGDVVALNTAYNHLGRAEQNVPDNMDAQALNRVRRAWSTGAGSDQLTPFETDVKIAADELAKAYGNNSEAGRQSVEHLLEPDQSPAQLRTRLKEARELLGGKLGAYQHQFDAVAPKGSRFDIRPRETVKLKFPNGKTLDVPVDDVEEAKTKFKAVEERE